MKQIFAKIYLTDNNVRYFLVDDYFEENNARFLIHEIAEQFKVNLETYLKILRINFKFVDIECNHFEIYDRESNKKYVELFIVDENDSLPNSIFYISLAELPNSYL